MLAAGRTEELRDVLAAQPQPTLFAEVVQADMCARMLEVDLPELQALQQRVDAAPGDPTVLRWWLGAVVAERMIQDADLEAAAWATKVLAEVPSDPLAPFDVVYVRARLRRVAGILHLVAPAPAEVAAFEQVRDSAVDDFLRCGFREEAAATRAVTGAIYTVVTWEDPLESLAVIQELRGRLGDDGRSQHGAGQGGCDRGAAHATSSQR